MNNITKGHVCFFTVGACIVVIAVMVVTFTFANIYGIGVVKESVTDAESAETNITIETLPFTDLAPKETDEESTEVRNEVATEVESEVITEAAPTMYEEEFPWYTSDYELLARLLWAEARGESYEGQLAVVEVIFNRVASPSFPYTVYDVIYEPWQFTTATSLECVTPTQMQYDVVTAALKGERVLNNENCVFFSRGSCYGTYYTTIGNHVFGTEN